MSYEAAPATRLLATHCAICHRPLLDARSVECGVGPVCRQRHGYNEIPEAVRVEANRIVHRIACLASGHDAEKGETLVGHLTALGLLGCHKIVNKLAENLAAVEIITEGQPDDLFAVKSPYNPDAVTAMRNVPGRRWDGRSKVNTFPRTSWPQVAALLADHYPNTIVRQANGHMTTTVTDGLEPGFDVPTPEPTTTPEAEAPKCVVRQRGNTLYVQTPYSREAVSRARGIRGRKYQGDGINTFPASRRDEVMAMIADCFPGMEVDAGLAAAATTERPDWHTVDTDAPEVDYDPRDGNHRAWLAEQITELCDAMGFTPVPREDLPRACRELVLGRSLDNGVQLRVYTSAEGGSCRREGADAVRVCAVKFDSRRGRWNGVANITRVNRTGKISAIVGRVHERIGDVWADVHTPAMGEASAPLPEAANDRPDPTWMEREREAEQRADDRAAAAFEDWAHGPRD